MKQGEIRPKHPERICWGCDNYCPVKDLRCGNRSPHPIESDAGWDPETVADSDPVVPGAGLEPALTLR